MSKYLKERCHVLVEYEDTREVPSVQTDGYNWAENVRKRERWSGQEKHSHSAQHPGRDCQ